MFVGHFAAALAAKRLEPQLSLGPLVAAAFALDLIWPVLVLAGVERVRIDPAATRFTPLAFDYYPWSHSLLMALVWGVVVGLAMQQPISRRAGPIAGALVVSHWVLDFITHRPDLPLFPGTDIKLGLGLWNSIAGTLLLEGALLAIALVLYVRIAPARDAIGRWGLWTLVLLMLVIWISGPFAPPPPGSVAIALAGLAMWLFPPWAAWADRHRRRY